MSVQLEISLGIGKFVRKLLNERKISLPDFLAWKQALEFNLAEDPHEQLQFAQRGDIIFHEYRSLETAGTRRFRVTWEIEWDRGASRFHLLEIRITELPGPPPLGPS